MTVRPLRSIEAAPAPLRVITGRERPRSRSLAWVLYTLAAVAAFLALIYLRTAVDESAFEIRQLQRQIDAELARQHQLHLEKIRLESPDEIVPIAEEMLGMVLPEDVIPVTAARVAGTGPYPADSAADVSVGGFPESTRIGNRGDRVTEGASR